MTMMSMSDILFPPLLKNTMKMECLSHNCLKVLGFTFYIVVLFCFVSGTCLKTLVGHSSAVTAVQFNLDGTLVLSCSYDGKCCVWDVLSGCCLKSILSNETSLVQISHARLSPNGKYLLMSTLDSVIRLWDYKIGQGRVLKSYKGGIKLSEVF